jgi:hypothetical protein
VLVNTGCLASVTGNTYIQERSENGLNQEGINQKSPYRPFVKQHHTAEGEEGLTLERSFTNMMVGTVMIGLRNERLESRSEDSRRRILRMRARANVAA